MAVAFPSRRSSDVSHFSGQFAKHGAKASPKIPLWRAQRRTRTRMQGLPFRGALESIFAAPDLKMRGRKKSADVAGFRQFARNPSPGYDRKNRFQCRDRRCVRRKSPMLDGAAGISSVDILDSRLGDAECSDETTSSPIGAMLLPVPKTANVSEAADRGRDKMQQ